MPSPQERFLRWHSKLSSEEKDEFARKIIGGSTAGAGYPGAYPSKPMPASKKKKQPFNIYGRANKGKRKGLGY